MGLTLRRAARAHTTRFRRVTPVTAPHAAALGLAALLSHGAVLAQTAPAAPANVAPAAAPSLAPAPAPAAEPAQATLPAVQVKGRRGASPALSLEAPVDAGSRLGLSARDTPASLSRIDAAAIEERGIVKLQDVVTRMPGMTSAAGAGNGGTALTGRGFSGPSSVVQMLDGTRLIVGAGTVSFPVSTWAIEAVEVLRGPSSVLFGDGAIGAAVNYVTKRPTRVTEREAYAAVGSHDIYRAGIGARGPIDEQWSYAAYLNGERNGGYIDKTDASFGNYAGTLQYQPDGRLKVSLSVAGANQDGVRYRGTPVRNNALDPALRRTNFNVADANLAFNDRQWRTNAEYKLGDHITLRNELYYLTTYRQFRDVQNYAYNSAGGIDRSRYVHIFHHQRQLGNRFDATGDGTLGGLKNKLTAGFEAYRVRFEHVNNSNDLSTYTGSSPIPNPYAFDPGNFDDALGVGPVRPRADTRLRTQAVFVEDALDLTQELNLVTGLRKDHMAVDARDVSLNTPVRRRFTPLTGRAGLVWTVSQDLSLYGQFSTATDPAAGILTLTTANQGFDLATGRQVELGAKGGMPAWNGEWTLASYYIQKRNLVSAHPDGSQQQIGQQSSRGVEAAISFEPARNWTLDLNAAVLDARYDRFDERVGSGTAAVRVSRAGNLPTNVPERMANVWAAYRFLPGWKAGVNVQHVGKRSGDSANTTWVPAYTLVDATLSWDVSSALRLDLAARNLGDKTYGVAAANNGTQWILGDPRTVELTARLKF